ncbi:hypothetical protein [Thalassobellus citreus]|uniref:hypothetical protein n=1 Tax=Thalassobellus citreus TaxID=3367752 RepID=UPI0037A76113
MAKKKDLHSALEGLHFDILNDYIEKGVVADDMEPEIQDYLLQLQFIQQRLHRVESPGNVINSLMAFFPQLNIKSAKSRFDDALRFFHLDKSTSNDALRNMLFEIAMKAIQLAIRTCKTDVTALKIVDAVERAARVKGLHLPDKEPIPDGLLDEKVEIHSLTPADVGLPEANRHILAEYIDQMPLEETQKLKLKMEAGVKPKEIFNFNEQTKD